MNALSDEQLDAMVLRNGAATAVLVAAYRSERVARQQLHDALRGIAPQVGSMWEWEPLTESRETLVVTDVSWNGEECFVTSRRFVDHSVDPKTFQNDLSRWVEATVFLREADAPVDVHYAAPDFQPAGYRPPPAPRPSGRPHLSECLLLMFPGDPAMHCTCDDDYPTD